MKTYAGMDFFLFLNTIPNNKEFCYGDGFLDGFSSGLGHPFIRGRFILPITPEICLYYFNTELTFNYVNCASMYVSNDLIEHINWIAQLYSKKEIFYRYKVPKISEEFRGCEHYQLEYHSDGWLSEFESIAHKGCVPHMPIPNWAAQRA